MRSNGLAVVVLCIVMAAAGCHKHKPVTTITALPPTPPPPSAPPPLLPSSSPLPVEAPPVAAPSPAASMLNDANRAFVSGNCDEAARGFESYLKVVPAGGQRDEALFHLGLSYASCRTPAADWKRASATFKQLVDEYPNSPFRVPASLILTLRAEVEQVGADARQRDQKVKQLTTELDRLKKIDADRRRRP
jgi:TolA-binding protein